MSNSRSLCAFCILIHRFGEAWTSPTARHNLQARNECLHPKLQTERISHAKGSSLRRRCFKLSKIRDLCTHTWKLALNPVSSILAMLKTPDEGITWEPYGILIQGLLGCIGSHESERRSREALDCILSKAHALRDCFPASDHIGVSKKQGPRIHRFRIVGLFLKGHPRNDPQFLETATSLF